MHTSLELQHCATPHEALRAELDVVDWNTPRGGASWDPFAARPAVKLSSAAQHELVAVMAESHTRSTEAEGKSQRARSAKRKAEAARTAYGYARLHEWAKETLAASMSLLLVSRVELARNRFGTLVDAEELMAHALTCAVESFDAWSGEGKLYQYVMSRVDAYLAKRAVEQQMSGVMPEAWTIALRHVPSIVSELERELDRAPSDPEVGERLLSRARQWAEARIVERGGVVDPQVLPELVDAKLTKQGMFAAARNIGRIRSVARGTVSLTGVEDVDDFLGATSSAGAVVEQQTEVQGLQALLSAAPDLPDEELKTLLSSSLWARLCLHRPVPVSKVASSRKAPDPIDLVAA